MSNKRKLCECQALPSRNQRKSLRRRKVCEVVETASASNGSTKMDTPSSFTKVLISEYQIHTSIHQCALILPRSFCDEHNVPNHVTMADSTGHKLWHMRCNDSRVEEGMTYKISNGWREFAYDHSLKLHDELVFTFVPPSHFVVEFATGVMRPTRDGKKYPWKKPGGKPWLNYSENVQGVAKAKPIESGSNGVSGLVESSASTSRGLTNTTSPLSFTKILTSKYQIHTSVYSCSLSLPRLFCDEHKVPNNVTMTDSAGHTLWHMRCNDRVSTRGVFRISNGWREFAHDHSLKLYDKLVFTFVSPSHFVVNFATSRRLTSVMRPTQEGKDYSRTLRSSKVSGLHVSRDMHGVDMAATIKLPLPREQSDPKSNTVKIKSQKRKDTSRRHHMRVVPRRVSNLAPEAASARSGSTDTNTPSSFTKVLASKSHIHRSTIHHCVLVIPRPFCDDHNVPNHVTMTDSTGHKLWHMRCQDRVATRGAYRISNGWREFAYDHSLKPNDKLVFTFVPPSHFVVEFATGAMHPTPDGKYPWVRQNSYSISMEAQARVTTTLPNSSKQTAEGDILYQSSTVKVENQFNSILEDSTSKLPSFPELTHLECKNPDGTSYLQLLDSDGDVTDEYEEVAHGYNLGDFY